jgi:hypothetical protein
MLRALRLEMTRFVPLAAPRHVDTLRSRVGNTPRRAGALTSSPLSPLCSRRSMSCTWRIPCVVGLMAIRRSKPHVYAASRTTGPSTPHGVTLAPRMSNSWPVAPGSTSRAARSWCWRARECTGSPSTTCWSQRWRSWSPMRVRCASAQGKNGESRCGMAGGTLGPWPRRAQLYPAACGASVARSHPHTCGAGPDPDPGAQSHQQALGGYEHQGGPCDVRPLWHQWASDAQGVVCGGAQPSAARGTGSGNLTPPVARVGSGLDGPVHGTSRASHTKGTRAELDYYHRRESQPKSPGEKVNQGHRSDN